MDLTSFNSSKKEIEKELISSQDVNITTTSQTIIFNLKSKKALEEYKDVLFFSPTQDRVSSHTQDLQSFFEQSIKDGVEGLMIKDLDMSFKPGTRTGAMAKVKEVKEDVDVVILGAEYGKGKRAGFYSSFIVGVQDNTSEEQEFLTIGKVSSGIKELEGEGVTLAQISELLAPLKTHEEKGLVFFEPKIVIQVRYQEIQESQTYSSGLALRFPRIISLREDKLLSEITSIEELETFMK